MTAGQTIDYDALALEALRGVVKACLAQVSRTGLVGDHHFYIAFNTQAPGVSLSKRLKEKYPVEMTIVLQHRFWDLAVDEDRFEVKLTFDGVPERLVVPFKAVKVFYDPSVPYVLQFEEVEGATQGEGVRRGIRRAGPQMSPIGSEKDEQGERIERRRPQRRDRDDRQQGEQSAAEEAAGRGRSARQMFDEQGERLAEGDKEKSARPVAPAAAAPPSRPAIVAVAKGGEAGKDDEKTEPAEASGAKIFDLSKFRGKK
ncbi:MAG: hypothetical protein JSS20_16105 [Proteobacteria bacterium]|nr:hypothetical protein [Pseudomonadota bacterium]